jgi:hypothetical protein
MHLTEAEQIIASVSANPSTAFCKRCAVYPNTVGWVDSFGLAQDKSPDSHYPQAAGSVTKIVHALVNARLEPLNPEP